MFAQLERACLECVSEEGGTFHRGPHHDAQIVQDAPGNVSKHSLSGDVRGAREDGYGVQRGVGVPATCAYN